MAKTPADCIRSAQEELDAALEGLDSSPTEPDTPQPEEPPIDPPAEEDPPKDVLDGHFVVGYAKGKPGEIVHVLVSGGTNFEARGFALGIGVKPEVAYIPAESGPTEELESILHVEDPQVLAKQQKGSDWYDQFVQLGVIFYGTLGDLVGLFPDEAPETPPKRGIVDRLIPHRTPLFRLAFRIPPNAQTGSKINLSIEHYHGNRLLSGDQTVNMDWHHMYNTHREVSRTGVYPPPERRVSGWIEVL